MTKQEFQKLTEDHVLLLDGATGSNLMKAGMPRGVCTESWVLEHKDVIQSLQKAYIEAGSHIIYAPTFGGNRINLTMHGLEDQIEQINHTLAGYSKEIAPEGVFVAGDITTTGKMMAPAGDMTYEKAFEVYQEQIGYLRDAGVDLIVAETMINIEETLAARRLPECLRASYHLYRDCRSRRKYLQRRKCHRGCHVPGSCRCRRCRHQLLGWPGSAGIGYPQYQGERFHSGHCQTQCGNAPDR